MKRLFLRLVILAVVAISPVVGAIDVDTRHKSSGLNDEFKFRGLTFDNYIRLSKNMIANARVDLKGPTRDQIIEANAPFSLLPSDKCPRGATKPYQRGVLLIHGLTDSPYFMRPLGKFFAENCFRVMGLLLPGHGTRPGDLLNVKWQEWAGAVNYGVGALSNEAERVYLVGFSTGGALSVYQSLNDRRVRGLFLFSPAIKVSSLAALANWHEVYSETFERAKWLDIAEDVDPYKYESFPKNAADQIHLLTVEVRRLLGSATVTVPVFVAASLDDMTVDTAATIEFFKKLPSKQKKMILYATTPSDFASTPGIQVVNSQFSERKILSSAHTAIVLPATDSHYGLNGDYRNCLHYLDNKEQFARCKGAGEAYLGEITPDNLKKGIVRRLMFNPNFDSLEAAIKESVDTFP